MFAFVCQLSQDCSQYINSLHYPFHFILAWPNGKASDFDSEDCWFESNRQCCVYWSSGMDAWHCPAGDRGSIPLYTAKGC